MADSVPQPLIFECQDECRVNLQKFEPPVPNVSPFASLAGTARSAVVLPGPAESGFYSPPPDSPGGQH